MAVIPLTLNPPKEHMGHDNHVEGSVFSCGRPNQDFDLIELSIDLSTTRQDRHLVPPPIASGV